MPCPQTYKRILIHEFFRNEIKFFEPKQLYKTVKNTKNVLNQKMLLNAAKIYGNFMYKEYWEAFQDHKMNVTHVFFYKSYWIDNLHLLKLKIYKIFLEDLPRTGFNI